MKNKHFSSLVTLVTISATSLYAQDTPPPVEKIPQQVQDLKEYAAVKNSAEAAELWLKLLDNSEFDKSWDYASLTLKLKVPKNHWVSLMDKIRKPLGKSNSRKLIDQRISKDPPGLPKGDYMVVLYQSAFAQKDAAKELLTLVQETDGHWRVLTYQVQ